MHIKIDNIKRIAKAAYTSYCKNVGGKAFNGDPLPTWEEFEADASKEKQVTAWRCAALAACLENEDIQTEYALANRCLIEDADPS